MRKSGKLLQIIFFSIIMTLSSTLGLAQDIETVRIGDQEWMKYNLKTDVLGSICYEMDSMNCERYGRLYFWQAALDACPEGFRLPTDEDWTVLIEHLGGDSVAGKKLKKGGDSGFDALFAGNYHPEVKLFSYKGEKGYYWTASSHGFHATWIRSIQLGEDAIKRASIGKSFYFSIRCIKVD